MTSRQVGQQIGRLSGSARNGARRQTERSGRAGGEWSAREKRRLAQLAVCGILFAGMVAVKLLLPARMAQLRERLEPVMQENMDVAAVFSAVGRAFSGAETFSDAAGELYQAVFHSTEDPAVETAAEMPETMQTSEEAFPLACLRAFAEGKGSGSSWLLSAPDAAPAAGQTAAASAGTAAAPADAADTASAGETAEQETTATLRISKVLYSQDNLPDNVSMEQAVLGFDYCTPVSGTLSSGFGYRVHPIEGEELFHYGVDLAADTGTEIDAFASGTVTAVGESSSYGKYLMISHPNGFTTLYAHCSRVTVSSGASVREGEKIAEVGETGQATGPHLHFELQQGEEYLNPIYYVHAV